MVTQPAELRRAAAALAAGHGPVAVDTERASGYRYSQRAYLVQLRREGAGTVLVDPVALNDEVEPLIEALDDTEWVLHAASQDLPCLAELGMRPSRLFDTELAGRLAGFDRVALGTLVERVLGYRLEKGHGAADWSRRPLPREWLNYAALDVELLVPLRDALEAELTSQGKLEWALQEFTALRDAPRRSHARSRGDALRASTGHVGPARWPSYARCGKSVTPSPGNVMSHPAGCCPTVRSWTPPSRRRSTRRAWSNSRSSEAGPNGASPGRGRGR
nr:Ribonuclease D (EC 3.1.26.3) [Kibdelosporangium sp. MJ126-NF4]